MPLDKRAWIDAGPGSMFAEVLEWLREQHRLAATITGLWQRLCQLDLTVKKVAIPKLYRLDLVEIHSDWRSDQLRLNARRLVYIDETWVNTNIICRYGHSLQGKNSAFVADLGTDDIIASTCAARAHAPPIVSEQPSAPA